MKFTLNAARLQQFTIDMSSKNENSNIEILNIDYGNSTAVAAIIINYWSIVFHCMKAHK